MSLLYCVHKKYVTTFSTVTLTIRVRLYYCDVLLSQQMLPAIKRVAERCLFTKQYVACGEIGHFFVFCNFPR